MVLVEGSAAKLECRVSAFPDPLIIWYKDGKELKDGPECFRRPRLCGTRGGEMGFSLIWENTVLRLKIHLGKHKDLPVF